MRQDFVGARPEEVHQDVLRVAVRGGLDEEVVGQAGVVVRIHGGAPSPPCPSARPRCEPRGSPGPKAEGALDQRGETSMSTRASRRPARRGWRSGDLGDDETEPPTATAADDDSRRPLRPPQHRHATVLTSTSEPPDGGTTETWRDHRMAATEAWRYPSMSLFSRTNWLAMNVAPWGSLIIAILDHGDRGAERRPTAARRPP